MKIPFSKYQGTGNDFILIDERCTQHALSDSLREKMCDRKFGIGADGLILLRAHPKYDFEMKVYNADGKESSMCGNGARCLIQFARDLGMQHSHFRFLAIDGEHEATVVTDHESRTALIELKMQSVVSIEKNQHGYRLNTGSPHLVCEVKNLNHFDVFKEGKALRHSPAFEPAGLNVNFIETTKAPFLIRTFERGVEDETLSCGTGAIAAAIAYDLAQTRTKDGKNEVAFQTRGGPLRVRFDRRGPEFHDVWLIGPASRSYEGVFTAV
jgi:diaminopimelate epimerase